MKMNTQYEIMNALWDNPNTQGIALLMQDVVMPAIAKMDLHQQIEAMGTVREAMRDVAEYEACKEYMTETIKNMRERYNRMIEK